MIKAMAEYIIAIRNNTHRRNTLSTQVLSHNWTYRFIQRHSFLKFILSKPIESRRAKACTCENFEEWFNRYRMTTSTFRFEPSNIYNIDETGFQMGDGERTYVVIDQRVSTEKYATKGDQTENISVIECGCMDGTV